MCDARKFRCARVFVTTRNFYESENLACKVESSSKVSAAYSVVGLQSFFQKTNFIHVSVYTSFHNNKLRLFAHIFH